jgi:hypothetical protein
MVYVNNSEESRRVNTPVLTGHVNTSEELGCLHTPLSHLVTWIDTE